MGENKLYYNDITILKAMATVFITWFHFKWSVPEELAPLFVGGAVGNSLFFFCAGYLLKFKEERYLGKWLLGKYLRIMPAIWVVFLLFGLFDLIRFGTFALPSVGEWLFPTRYWFVVSILIYFLIFYLLRPLLVIADKRRNMVFLGLLLIIIGIQIVWYILYCDKSFVNIDEGYLKAWYFLVFMLWGYYVKTKELPKQNNKLAYLYALIAFCLFYFYKRLSIGNCILSELQVVFVPLLLAFIVYSFRMVAINIAEIRIPDRYKRLISKLSNMTLEVYIVQMYLINWIMPLFPFPVNFVTSLVSIVIVSYIVHYLATKVAGVFKFAY